MSFLDLSDGSDDRDDTSDGSGLPGYPLDGHSDWRVGVPGPNGGLMGVVRVSNLLSGSGAGSADLPPGYMYDSSGKLQMTPQFAQTHPKGPFDFGAMAHNIHWGGVLADLANIAGGSIAGAGAGEVGALLPSKWAITNALAGVLGLGGQAWKAQDDANRPGSAGAPDTK